MALISLACFDTVENDRTKYTEATLNSLLDTVNFFKHRLFIIDNASCVDTKVVLKEFRLNFDAKYPKDKLTIITLIENVGTARAINEGWKHRVDGEHCIKIDNDMVIRNKNWVEELEFCVDRDEKIGQIGLKRKDLLETPYNPENWYKSELIMLKHNPGEKWYLLEKCNHIMGSCVLHSSKLIDKIGYLYQPGLYGFDDSLYSLRSKLAGFDNYFLPHIEVDHIDTGENLYTKIKIKQADESWKEYCKVRDEYIKGIRNLYQGVY